MWCTTGAGPLLPAVPGPALFCAALFRACDLSTFNVAHGRGLNQSWVTSQRELQVNLRRIAILDRLAPEVHRGGSRELQSFSKNAVGRNMN
jgi:hypothetical protein